MTKARTKAKVYSFCESVIGIGPWHIRVLTPVGQKLGGGIDSPSLCGRVRPDGDDTPTHRGLGGWDLNVPITKHHLTHCCRFCCEEYEKAGGR